MKSNLDINMVDNSDINLKDVLKSSKNPEFDYKIFEKKDSLDLREGYGFKLSVKSVKILNKIDDIDSSSDEFEPDSDEEFME